jgi:hypothetical protein
LVALGAVALAAVFHAGAGWAGEAVSVEQIEELRRAIALLNAQNQALAKRVATLEAEPSRPIERASVAQSPVQPSGVPPPAGSRSGGGMTAEPTAGPASLLADQRVTALERRVAELEDVNSVQRKEMLRIRREKERLAQRVWELESATPVPTAKPRLAPSAAAGNAGGDGHRAEPDAPVVPQTPGVESGGTRMGEGDTTQLEQRVRELEMAQAAQEGATRAIIRDAMTSVGSNINELVAFGGTLEVATGWAEDFEGKSEGVVALSTAELDFEVVVNEWVRGGLVIEYDDGTSNRFQTVDGSEVGIDRINLDTGSITLGNTLRFPPFLTGGRLILPFGISTGNPVTDVLTIEDPLTITAFEQRQTAIGLGVAFPTPEPVPLTPPVTVPPVKPLVLNPLFGGLSTRLGYTPPPRQPRPLDVLSPEPTPPPFNAAVYAYAGETFEETPEGFRPDNHYNATIGYRTQGHCGRPYDELQGSNLCPWSLDIDLDYNSSVFDSSFLREEYGPFLGDIGFVPGMAASIKATVGPLSFVGEWNGALGEARFSDELGNRVSIAPSAWQVSVGYQFGWNPWVREIGTQGTYFTLGYSESADLAGVARLIDGEPVRVGSLAQRQFLIGAGEWFLGGLKLAIEYSHLWDYPKDQGGTGRSAHGVLTSLTLVW